MPFETEKIRVMALGIFKHDEHILVIAGYDKKKDEHFFRLPGGGIDFGETSEEALRREMKEEFGCEISKLKLLQAQENLFTYEGHRGHEIIFLYEGILPDQKMHQEKLIPLKDKGSQLYAHWIPIKKFLLGEEILYPVFEYRKIFG